MNYFELTAGERISIHGLRGSAGLFSIASQPRKTIVVATNDEKMEQSIATLATFKPGSRIFPFPALDGSPFSFAPVHASTRRIRLLVLAALRSGDWDLIVTTPQALLEPIPPLDALLDPTLTLEVGGSYDLGSLANDLVRMGYLSCDMISQPGDFARRGGILDIYSFVDETAYRLEFFDDELEEIRPFDAGTQRSTGSLDDITILPLYEWTIEQERAERFNTKGGSLWNQSEARGQFLGLVAQIRDRGRFPGYLHWTSLFFQETSHFYDLIEGPFHCFIEDWDLANQHQEDYLTRLEVQMESIYPGIPAPHIYASLFGTDRPTHIDLGEGAHLRICHQLKLDDVDQEFVTHTVPHYNNDVTRFFSHWCQQAARQAIVLVCLNQTTARQFEETLEDDGEHCRTLAFPLETLPSPGFYVATGHLETGFSWPERNLIVVSEKDIFSKVKKPRRQVQGKQIFHAEFRDLKVGDYVVHLDHGVGRFTGLVEMAAGGGVHEMMALVYRDNQKLYVNLNQLDLIHRYGSETSGIQLDKLGGVSWAKTRSRVKKAVREMAGELIKLYAARQVVGGRVYGADTDWQHEFEEAFEHEPTDGQLIAMADIKRDLESEKPMDRLLVGDVGFGKTEVAMRLSFKAVMEGVQTAVLCPTTVLAFQHYHTFKNRFTGYPVNIAWLSRFTPAKRVKEIVNAVNTGEIDILIGTHRILGKDIQFKDLGVLIIDEEQRFGVSHKEKLKQFRKQVDVLSMSATPIPRTLNMSMSGIRDISVIETAPRNRLAISTTVAETRPGLIKNAIDFELQRGGQVFYIHNRIETMETLLLNLKKLVPNARLDMAHGQMDSKRIESVMLAFMRHDIDVLISSTIIENGVDIPNANTMIVNRANGFGMSQLYQLRGRIGRSDRPAFAYLLVPHKARMTDVARKRLATLEEFSYLGSGFRIAAMDMELRGAGNLLGGEQAGHINAIGYETYIKLLEEAVDELRGKKVEDLVNCLVKLNLNAGLPRTYIEEPNQRLHYYKQLSTAKTLEDVTGLFETLNDMYGLPPAPVQVLCDEHRLRIKLSARKVLGVEREGGRLKLRFHVKAEVSSELVLGWISEGRDVKISPDGMITLPLDETKAEHVLPFIEETVALLLDEGED